jgi:hypothetical protein
LAALACAATAANDRILRAGEPAELRGDMAHPDQLSGVTFWRDLMIVCPDEGAEFNVFQAAGPQFDLIATVNLLSESDDEIDMEGAASDSNYVYIVGSHSMRRKRIDDEGTYKKNRKRLTRVTPHKESYSLFRIKLGDDGQLLAKDRVDLREIIGDDEVLGPFFSMPGKENGIDIEGVAVRDGTIFVGFRGPVLRGNFVPVLAFDFEQPHEYELKYVQLGGRGIRDLVAVDDGFLILAGPVGDGDGSYRLYLWNGEDGVPGEGGSQANLVAIGELSTELGTKPEGIAIASQTADEWQLLVVSDGDARASRWTVRKPLTDDASSPVTRNASKSK